MTYEQLDINQKINTKAALQAWAKYSVQHFQAELDKKVYKKSTYGVRRTRTGYKYSSIQRRQQQLRKSWWQRVDVGGGVDRVMIQFLLYGRYVDMGVGRGLSHTDRQVNRVLKLGRNPRTRKAWYSKRKGYEIKRLREILAAQNVHLLLDSIENTMSFSLNLNLT